MDRDACISGGIQFHNQQQSKIADGVWVIDNSTLKSVSRSIIHTHHSVTKKLYTHSLHPQLPTPCHQSLKRASGSRVTMKTTQQHDLCSSTIST